MRLIIRIKAMLAIILLLSAFTITSDIVERLGTDHKQAQQSILNNLIEEFDHEPVNVSIVYGESKESRSFKIPYLKLLPSIIQGDRQQAAKDVCQYLRDYINSEEFIADYENVREKAKPVEEPYRFDAETLEGFKAQLKEMEASLADMKAANASPDMIRQIETGIADQKKMIAEQSDPTPNNTKWMKIYPEDPAVLVKAKLNEYIKLAATVDFDAKLTTVGQVKKFVNPAYEAKSLKWKAIFRSGKEVTDVGVAFAKEWLTGDIIASGKVKMSKEYSTVKKESVSAQASENSSKDTDQPIVDEAVDDKTAEEKPKGQFMKTLKDKTKKVLE